MLMLNLRRIFRTGFVQFWRNGVVSLSAVLVMVITLFVIAGVIFSSAMLKQTLESIKDKVDINVYFVTSASESEVLVAKEKIEKLSEVDFVAYISRDVALENFKEEHKDDRQTMDALSELDENPLGASLSIKAKEPSQYEEVANFLEQNYPTGSIVEKVNYFQNKQAIDVLTQIIDAGEKLGAIITVAFIIISILITLNTIRLAMFISRDEINVMKLVGASSNYIAGPFLVTGAVYGLVSAIITLIILWPVTFWLGPMTEKFFIETNVFQYYIASFGQIFLILIFAGIFIGSISSYLAIKRYLRIR
jgi:cell division transport system permease protein